MKEQSGWGWGPTSFLPEVDDYVWEKYIVVSICTSYVLSPLRLISLKQYLKSKNFFIKPFPHYKAISNLLGDSYVSRSVAQDMWQSPKPLQVETYIETPTVPHFAIDLVLEEMSHASQAMQEDKSERSVCFHLYLCVDLANRSNLSQSAQVGFLDKGKQPTFWGLEKETISSISYYIDCILSYINLYRMRRWKHSTAWHPTSAASIGNKRCKWQCMSAAQGFVEVKNTVRGAMDVLTGNPQHCKLEQKQHIL